jgi:hypothetical protein
MQNIELMNREYRMFLLTVTSAVKNIFLIK